MFGIFNAPCNYPAAFQAYSEQFNFVYSKKSDKQTKADPDIKKKPPAQNLTSRNLPKNPKPKVGKCIVIKVYGNAERTTFISIIRLQIIKARQSTTTITDLYLLEQSW